VLDGSPRLDRLLDVLEAEAQACAAQPDLALYSQALRDLATQVRAARAALLAAKGVDAEPVLRVADDFLQGLGYTLLAWAWARIARHAPQWAHAAERERMQVLACYGIQWLLPAQQWRWERILHNDKELPWIHP
jgi:hypothetical protein